MQDDEIIPVILKERDVPCPRCGYNLRGAASAVCPECGEELCMHPQPVVSMHNFERPPGHGLVQLSIVGLAIPTIALAAFIASLFPMWGVSGDLATLVFALALVTIHLCGIYALHTYRVAIGRMRRGWWLVLPLCWWWVVGPVILVVYSLVIILL